MYLHQNLSTKVKYKMLVSQQTLMLQLESKSQNWEQTPVPQMQTELPVLGICTLFRSCTLEFPGRLQNSPRFYHPCAVGELCRLPGRAGVTALWRQAEPPLLLSAIRHLNIPLRKVLLDH